MSDKIILILGSGAQGSAVAQNMNDEPNVKTIICADYDLAAVQNLEKKFSKVKGYKVNAKSVDEIISLGKSIGQKIDLIVNALPLCFARNCLNAALALECNYQDFAAGDFIKEGNEYERGKIDEEWVDGIKYMLSDYAKKFKAINKLAIIGTGSAPGLVCLATRLAVKDLDTCDTIYNICYEGVKAKRFIPFWFAPVVALSDMAEPAYAYEKGEIIQTPSMSFPIERKYDELNKTETFYEHAHDEPVYYALAANEYLKGCKNAYFKYGGIGIDFSLPLLRCGLLSHKPETINGATIAPFDFVLSHIPPAPKYENEIQSIIDEGIEEDGGCLVVEAYGKKDGKKVLNELHVSAPGLIESFKRAKLTAEQYLTGQSGGLFTKLFVEEKYEQTGLISTVMLTYKEIDYYWDLAKKLDITYSIIKKSY